MYWKNSYVFLVQKLLLNILSHTATNANVFLHIVQNSSTSNIWIFSPFNSYGCLFPSKFLEFLCPQATYNLLLHSTLFSNFNLDGQPVSFWLVNLQQLFSILKKSWNLLGLACKPWKIWPWHSFLIMCLLPFDMNLLSSSDTLVMVQQGNPAAFFISVQDNLSSLFLTQHTCKVFPFGHLCSFKVFPKIIDRPQITPQFSLLLLDPCRT